MPLVTTYLRSVWMRWSSAGEWIGRKGVLGGEVLVDPLEAALTPDTGLFDPAEGGRGVRHHSDIQAEHPRFQRFDEALAAREVLGVGVRDQAVLGVIGDPDRLILIVESDNAQDRSEDLLAKDVAARSYAR